MTAIRLPRPDPPPPPPPPAGGPREKVLAWLGSLKNIAGCTAAIGGLGLTVTGVVGLPEWPFVVAALYAVGALVAPASRPAAPAGARLRVAELRRAVDAQLLALAAHAPAEVTAAAARVVDALREVLDRPHLLRAGSPETFVIVRTIDDYLPTALEVYLGLPPRYAETHRLDDGRTPRQVVVDQMKLLERGVRDVTEAAAAGDAARLLSHGRFLADRFGSTDLALPDPPNPSDLPDPPGPTA
ncbi:hypothetical protein FsymDg_1633 [Candidatus Protofrankia datiscae]|uniref:Uncharacterized protein n=3 Tax=Protofrankia TaxID=2994361 RepID=F8B4N7_9ACTN|nr:hypothetical protein [Candidatus Protofrankia datiscae]AEH09089.1 hypothetical protein FsymDg_1633 [Candidatus Protofrankia datiscae]